MPTRHSKPTQGTKINHITEKDIDPNEALIAQLLAEDDSLRLAEEY
jgi:hypothetical protein